MRISFGNTARQYQEKASQSIGEFNDELRRMYGADLTDRQLLQITANSLSSLGDVVTRQNKAIEQLVETTTQQQAVLDRFQRRTL